MRMTPISFNLSLALNTASGVLGDVAVRDRLDLHPKHISRAAMARATGGLRAIEAFVRRLILLLALQFEHDITVDISPREHPKKQPAPRAPTPNTSLRIFLTELVFPDTLAEHFNTDTTGDWQTRGPAEMPAAPILARIARLRRALNTAEARGRRLAYTLSRRRHGLLMAPFPLAVPARMGTEFAHLYRTYGFDIRRQSCARPPPTRARPPPRPRIRQL